MKYRIMGAVTAVTLSAGALLSPLFGGVSHAKIDNPTHNDCHGTIVSLAAQNGFNPAQITQFLQQYFGFEGNAGDVNQFIAGVCAEIFGHGGGQNGP